MSGRQGLRDKESYVRRQAKAPTAESTPVFATFSSLLRADGSGAPSLRLSLAPLFALAAIAALALALVPSASAALTRPHTGSFGSFTSPSPRALAVDQASGDIYVVDQANQAISRFDSAGNPAPFSALSGSNTIDGAGGPDAVPEGGFALDFSSQVAVDNSGGPTDGNIYIADSGSNFAGTHGTVDIFDSTGSYVGQLTGSTTPQGTWAPGFGYPCGLAVAPDGTLYVSGAFNATINRYTPSGAVPTDADYNAQISGVSGCGLAADSAGSVYAVPNAFGGSGTLTKYAASDFGQSGPSGTPIAANVTALNLDPSTDDLYADQGDHIQVFDSTGAPAYTFGSAADFGSSSAGVAVKGSGGNAYVSDPTNGEIDVFGPAANLPGVTTGSADNLGPTSATLNGTVNPDGLAVDDCHFEYGTDTSYGQTAPCAETVGSGTSDVAVHADLSGLAADTTYHFRLLAANANGTANGADQTFTTPPALLVTTGDATDVGATTASLNGTVDPLGAALTDCHFDYGTDTSYGQTAPCAETVGSGTGAVPVHADLTGLTPLTTYHFRLVAANANGTVAGQDHGFTTPAAPGISATAVSAVAYTDATVTAQINPHLRSTTYHVDYGLDQSYGQSTPESAPIGSDDSDHPASVYLSGLQAGTTYHFRFVATNSVATTDGDDATFTTFARPPAQSCPNAELRTGPSASLPDCRAYELVTPPDTNGLPPTAPVDSLSGGFDTYFAAPAGDSVLFSLSGALPGLDGTGYGDRYQALRTSGAWQTAHVSPSGSQAEKPAGGGASADHGFSFWRLLPGDRGSLGSPSSPMTYLRQPDGTFDPLGHGSLADDPAALGRYIAPGGGHVVFTSDLQLEPDAPAGVGPLGDAGPGYTNPPVGAVYDRTPTGLRVASLLPGDATPGPGQTTYYRGVSADGSAIAFSVDRTLYLRRNGATLPVASGDSVPLGTDLTCTAGPPDAETTSLRWLRNGEPIPGATSPAYTTVAADAGAVIQCQVTATNANAGSTAVSIPGAVVAPGSSADVPVPPPNAIQALPSADLGVGGPGGQTLTCDPNASGWEGSPTFTYQWYRNGVLLSGNGADTDTYTVQAADLAAAAVFQCAVTATNAAGSAVAVSPNLPTTPEPSPSAPVATSTAPSTSAAPRALQLAGVSDDGRRVAYLRLNPRAGSFFPGDPSAWSGDLFLFDADSQTTTQITASADSFFTNVSADGSHVYFVSPQQLDGSSGAAGADNLYVWDEATGQIAFITVLAPGDVDNGPISQRHWINTVGAAQSAESSPRGPGLVPTRTTPDGRRLVFESRANLTGYDSAGHVEIYRYDADARTLLCLSCSPTGGPATSDATLYLTLADYLAFVTPPLETFGRSHLSNLTADGTAVFFMTRDRLLPADLDRKQDVYEWRQGQLALISSGQSTQDEWLIGMTPNAHDVFIVSADKLVPQKLDDTPAIYDARVNGGFPAPSSPPPCTGDACQGNPTPPPSEPASGSSGFVGPGNQGKSSHRCRKHRRLHHGKCIAKKHRKHHKHRRPRR
jgi:hypothetical protein